MRDDGKRNVAGVLVDVVDPAGAVARIVEAAERRVPCAVSALAAHGVVEGALDPELRYRLNRLDLVCPDGQPVRWAQNLLHGVDLRERVYGPGLMLRLLEVAQERRLGVYFYGSTEDVLVALQERMRARFEGLRIAGATPSRFRPLSDAETRSMRAAVRDSDAAMVFVGLGCPRQEVFAYEHRDALGVPIIAVGAAFDFHAGTLLQAPAWMGDRGLEWLFRWAQEPRRLFDRYTRVNAHYAGRVCLQSLGLRTYDPLGRFPRAPKRYG
ncbi:MAG: WecB/TagA/CpsF family glycosyltransferase [Sandaracinaceae bacterium]